MLLHDARVFPTAHAADISPLLAGLRPGATLGEFVRQLNGETSADEVLAELLDLDAQGAVRLVIAAADERLATAHADDAAQLSALLAADPGLDNVATYERNWKLYPDLYDFVGASNGLGQLKAFERDLYFDLLAEHLGTLPRDAHVLDAGCGVGRFTVEFVRRFGRVACVDASPQALKCTVRHALRAGATTQELAAHVGDVRRMPMFDDATFDAVFAMEVICYQTDPTASLREMARVLKPGGLAVLSVEGKYGGLLQDPRVTTDNLADVLSGGTLHAEGEIFVRYFTEDALRATVTDAGLTCVETIGSHYLPDGPLARLVAEDRLHDAAERAKIIELERICARDPALRPLARGWIAVARKD